MRSLIVLLLLATLAVPALAKTAVSIDDTIAACKAAGVQPAGKPVQSKEKKESSLIGMAYLNYIYQNDLGNPHFQQSMMLMSAQVPAGTPNPYVHLFDFGMGDRTLPILQEVQLAFDYAIDRSHPSQEKLLNAIARIKDVLAK